MLMHNPPHLREIIKELCIEPLGLSVTEPFSAFMHCLTSQWSRFTIRFSRNDVAQWTSYC